MNTSATLQPTTRPSAKALPQASSKLPVSRKFYARMHERVLSVLDALGIDKALTGEYSAEVMTLIDRHLSGETVSFSATACPHPESMVIFLTLRTEIDMAIARSRRAREAAARRRGISLPESAPATEPAPEPVPEIIPEKKSPIVHPKPKPPVLPKNSIHRLPWKKVSRPLGGSRRYGGHRRYK